MARRLPGSVFFIAIVLTQEEFGQLVAFVRYGLLDPDAKPQRLASLIPPTVPSGRPVLTFSELTGTVEGTTVKATRTQRPPRK